MSDNLTIFGTDYTGVTGIKAKSTGNGTLTYVRPTGTKSITENGTAIDVTQYANVDVDVSTGPDWPTFTTNDEGTAITCDKTYAECRALIQDGVTGAFAQFGSFSTVLIALWVNAANEDLRYIYVDNGVPASQLNYASDGTITMQDSADSVTSLDVIQNGTYSDGLWNEVEVNVPAPTPNLQSKTAIPTEQQQIVLPDSDYDYDGLSSVTVNAIPSTYVGSGITQRSSSDLTVGGATVTAPAGYYASSAQKTIPSGTEGTPTATKGTVSNNSMSITPSVTNSAGYITGSTKTGTPVTVSANELVSGTYTISASGTHDVANYASASVAAGSISAPTATKGTVSNHSVTVKPSVEFTNGYIVGGMSNGSAVTVRASELVSGTVTINGSGTTNVTNYASASVAEGNAVASATKSNVSNHSVTVTPSVTRTAGWVTAGTANGTAVSVSASELVSGSQTITENGTVDVTNLAEVVVDIDTSSKYTATIGTLGAHRSYIKYNNVIYSANSSFEFSAGDSCTIEAYGEYTGATIYENGIQIGSSDMNVIYTYALPSCDIEIVSSSTGGGARVDITKEGFVSLQSKTATPSTTQQVITADSGYDGLSQVTVSAMPSGTAGTPTATKGTVSNHSVSVTPSVTNTTGYITGDTKTGTAVTVSASELVSGSQTITDNGTVDVTNLASVDVEVSGYTATIIHAVGSTFGYPYIQVNGTGSSYSANETVFKFNDGDTFTIYLDGKRSAGGAFYFNDTLIYSSQGPASYV